MEGSLGGEGPSAATSKSKQSRGVRRATGTGTTAGRLVAELRPQDSPDNPPRTYPNSRCVFRGGYVEPELLDPIFLNIAQHAASLVTQTPGASANDFLNLLRERSPYSSGLRIECPHIAAAAFCLELCDLDRYDELRRFKKSTRAEELQGVLAWLATSFREMAALDESGKSEQLARQNAATTWSLPQPQKKYPFSVEFPDQVPVLQAELLALSQDLISVLAPKGKAGRPPEPTNAEIWKAWVAAGRPEIDSIFLTRIARMFYDAEWTSAATEPARRKLRERARKAIERGEEAAT